MKIKDDILYEAETYGDTSQQSKNIKIEMKEQILSLKWELMSLNDKLMDY